MRQIHRLSGFLCCLLGLSVLIGWYTQSAALIQIYPHWVPMQFNTALCFVLSGIGLLSLYYQRPRLSFVIGLVLLFITLLQYVSGANFGIDQFFVEHYITTNTPYPGRMSAITAVCFTLSGLAFALAHIIPRKIYKKAVVRFIGVAIVILSLIALIGYVRDVDAAYRWFSNASEMAAHTSVGFLLVGISLVTYTVNTAKVKGVSPFWFSGSAALFIVLLSLEWSQHLHVQESRLLSAAVEKEISFIRIDTIKKVESALVALKRMARRWEIRGGTPQNEWQQDASSYIQDVTALTTLEWVDDSYHVRWVEPLVGNEKALGLYVAYDDERRQVLDLAKKSTFTPALKLTPPLDLVQGYRAIIAYVPLYSDDRFDGFIVGIFDTNKLFNNSLSYLSDQGFNIRITDDKKYLFDYVSGSAVIETSTSTDTIKVFDRQWKITLSPTAEFAKKYISNLPNAILLVGVLFALAIGLLLQVVIQYLQRNTILSEKTNQLKESEGKIRAILDNAFDGLITIDNKGVVHSYNAACRKMFGYSVDEVVGNNINMLMPQSYRHEHDGYLSHYHETGEKKIIGMNREVIGFKKTGEEFPLELSVSEIYAESGKIYSGVIRDLSERKQSEDELISIGRIVEESLNEVYIFDAVTLNFLLVNKGARENLGYRMDELSELTPVDIKPEYTREEFLKAIIPLQKKSEESLLFETQHERKNGTLYNVEVHLQVAKYKGKKVFLAIILDVTERVKIEQEREAVSRVLEESNRELEEFAYRTSHDLRSPLVSSIKLVSVAEAAMKNGNNDRAMKSIKHIETSLVKLEVLVRDILALTKTKNVEEEEQSIDVNLIVEDALQSFSHMDNFTRLKIEKNLQFNEEIILKNSRVTMIVENLISNAVKYQDVTESQSWINITTAKEGNSFVFAVEDNGLGIPKSHHKDLFSMFKRFHSKVSFGSGLGLYMVKKSADILGGELTFESPEKGAKFKLTIPL